MRHFFKRSLGSLGVAVLALIGVSTANADYSIEVITGNFDSGQITAGSVFALPNSTASLVSVDVSALNTAMMGTGFQFTVLGGSSNALLASSSSEANIEQNGTVVRSDAGGTGVITIIATENGFNSPQGTPKLMTSAAADTFLNFVSTDKRTFQSTYSDANTTVSTPLQSFPASSSSNGTIVSGPFPALNSFTLTDTTVVTLADALPSDQFSGTTRVRSVPEPGSLALMVLGGTALAIRYRRRRASV